MRGTKLPITPRILIDGIDVSDPSNPARAFDLGSAIDVGRPADRGVLRGPQSGLYGADALGGVISIITKKGEGPAPRDRNDRSADRSARSIRPPRSERSSRTGFNYAFNVAHFRCHRRARHTASRACCRPARR